MRDLFSSNFLTAKRDCYSIQIESHQLLSGPITSFLLSWELIFYSKYEQEPNPTDDRIEFDAVLLTFQAFPLTEIMRSIGRSKRGKNTLFKAKIESLFSLHSIAK